MIKCPYALVVVQGGGECARMLCAAIEGVESKDGNVSTSRAGCRDASGRGGVVEDGSVGDASRVDGWWCQETRPMRAQHAASLRNRKLLAGSTNQANEAPGCSVAGEWLCWGWRRGLHPQICGFEACKGTMACSSGMLLPKTNADDTDAEALRLLSQLRVSDHQETSLECGARPSLR